MSPVTRSRFLVNCFDYEEWAAVVEATSREEAIGKAKAIYLTDALGAMNDCEPTSSDFRWSARSLTRGPFLQAIVGRSARNVSH